MFLKLTAHYVALAVLSKLYCLPDLHLRFSRIIGSGCYHCNGNLLTEKGLLRHPTISLLYS